MNDSVRVFVKSRWFLGVGAFFLGAMVVFGIRFANYSPEEQTHYHANIRSIY